MKQSIADQTIVGALGIAIGYSALAQGAFYSDQVSTVFLLIAVAATARAFVKNRKIERFVLVSAAAWISLAAWAVISGAIHGNAQAALPMAALSLAIAAAAWTTCNLQAQSREVLRNVILTIACAVAASGWFGVVWHHEPYALPSQGLWRAASTLTYANSTAAFLVIALFVALTPAIKTRGFTSLLVVWTLATGALLTLSRAGMLTILIGGIVYLVASPHRQKILRLWPLIPAVGIAFAGTLPSLPETASSQPLIAIGGLLAGVFILYATRHRYGAIVSVIALVIAIATIAGPRASDALNGISSTRLNAVSSDRDDLLRVTIDQFKTSPLTGVGPGQLNFEYINHDGIPVIAEFTHNEYVQLAAETGLIGLSLALIGLGALAWGAWRRRAEPLPIDAAASMAALTTFSTQSYLDFLWHIPALPFIIITITVMLLTVGGQEDHSS